MSIIYDALKKVGQSGNLSPGGIIRLDKAGPGLRIYLVYALVVVLGFFAASVFWNSLLNPLPDKISSVTSAKLEKSAKLENSPIYDYAPPADAVIESQFQKPAWTWTLNGIFFSQDEGYALINNQVAKVGDVIDGAKVVRIDVDEVELESEGAPIKLSPK